MPGTISIARLIADRLKLRQRVAARRSRCRAAAPGRASSTRAGSPAAHPLPGSGRNPAARAGTGPSCRRCRIPAPCSRRPADEADTPRGRGGRGSGPRRRSRAAEPGILPSCAGEAPSALETARSPRARASRRARADISTRSPCGRHPETSGQPQSDDDIRLTPALRRAQARC